MNTYQQPTEGTIVPSLLDYLQVLRRRKFTFLLIVFLVPATAVALSGRKAPEYEASSQVVLGGTSSQPQPGQDAQTQAQVARASRVLHMVRVSVPNSGLTDAGLRKASSVSTSPDTNILTFAVKASSPGQAMRLATAYADAYTNYRMQGKPPATLLQPATEAAKVGPRTVKNGAIGLFLGIILAFVVVFLADAVDTRIRSAETIREALNLRLLGRLPMVRGRRSKSRLVVLTDPASHEAEPFRVLRANFDFANAAHGSRTIMFTSGGNAEGKSTTVSNLAIALARAGRRVILIDADLRRPTLHTLFGLEARPGLTDVELGDAELDDALRSIHVAEAAPALNGGNPEFSRTGNLKVLPAGHALHDPDDVGAERAVGRIIQRAREHADLVLVDAAPLLVGDAIALSAHVDAVVLVTRLKALRKGTLTELGRILEASPAAKLGFIVTGAPKGDTYPRYPTNAPSEFRSASVLRLSTPRTPANAPQEPADELQRGTRANDT